MQEKHTANCYSCLHKHELTLVAMQGKHGNVVLRADDQGPLGRAIYVPFAHIWNRKLLLESYKHVLDEAHELAVKYEQKLYKLFGCEKMAVCQIGNLTRDEQGMPTSDKCFDHYHWHFIPSYSKPILFNSQMHVDDNYARPLNLDEKRGYKKMPLCLEDLLPIVNAIKELN